MLKQGDPKLSIILALIGFSFWANSDAIIKSLSAYPVIFIAYICSTFAMLFLALFSSLLGGFQETMNRPKLGLRLLRGFLISISNVLTFYAFTHLPMTKAYALIFFIPLLANIFAVLILKEHIKPIAWALSAMGFLGVLIVLRPGFVTLDNGSIAALGLTSFFAAAYVLTRRIGTENQTPLSMSLFQYIFTGLFLVIPAIFLYPPDYILWGDIAKMGVIGFCAAAGSLLVGRAYAMGPTAFVAPIHYTQILWGTIYGYILYNEIPDLYTMVGAAVIIIAGLILIKVSSKPQKV